MTLQRRHRRTRRATLGREAMLPNPPSTEEKPRALGSRCADELASLLADLAVRDPDVLLAVAEMDRSLIRLTLELSPLERVRSAAAAAHTLSRFRGCRS